MIARTHQLDLEVEKALPGILEQVTLAEIIDLFVAFGPEEFAAGPVRLFQLLLGPQTAVDSFPTFCAICSNQYPAIQEMMKLCAKPEDRRKIEEAKESREDSLNQWVFSTMIRISGFFEEGKATPPGLFFPRLLSTLMNLEVPELLACVGETLIPIFGAVIVYRYPDFPVSLAAQGGRTNLLTAIQEGRETPLADRFKRQIPVMAYCTIKSPRETEYNYFQMIGAVRTGQGLLEKK